MRKLVFTVVFMVVITVFFISVLAVINEVSRDRIEKNIKIQNVRSLLYAFDIFPEGFTEKTLSSTSTADDVPWEEHEILKIMNDRIKMVRLAITQTQKSLLKNSLLSLQDSVDIFVLLNGKGENIAFGFPLRGKGLWGTISAFAAVSADLTKMAGIDFSEQIETPGLGARITEKEFKYFFRNLNLSGFSESTEDRSAIIMVNKKVKTNLEQSTNSVQAITGATQTCTGVLNMVNTDMGFYLTLLKQNEKIFGNVIRQN